MTSQQQGQQARQSPDTSDRNSFLDGGDVSVRESACRSLRILLPILALYTLFSLAWTTPIASVLHTVTAGNTITRRKPQEMDSNPAPIIPPQEKNTAIDSSVIGTSTTTATVVESEQKSSTAAEEEERLKQQKQMEEEERLKQQKKKEEEERLKQQQQQVDQVKQQQHHMQNPNEPVKPLPDTQEKTTETGSTSTSTATSVTTDTAPTVVEKPVEKPAPVTTDTSASDAAASTDMKQVLVRPASDRRKTYNLDEPACMKTGTRAKTFLMVFMGHSGSTAIMSELKEHPQIHFELFEPVDHGEIQTNTSMALQYTRDFFERGIAQGLTPGFKIRPLHIRNDPEGWAKLAREYDTRIVWQYRRNSLKQAIGEYSYRVLKDNSIIEGLKTEDEVKKRCDIGAGCSFVIDDFTAFHEILTGVTRSDFAIAEAVGLILDGSECVHEVRYEDYLYHREGTMLDLLQFLGVDQVATQPQRYKATKDNICEVVRNWNDFCRAFYGCKVWRHLFEDSENGCSCGFAASPAEYCNTPTLS